MTYRAPDDREAKREARAEAAELAAFGEKVKKSRRRSLLWILVVIAVPFILVGVLAAAALVALVVLSGNMGAEDPLPKCEQIDGSWQRPDPAFHCVHHYCPPCTDAH